MRILLTGTKGQLGTALLPYLKQLGEVIAVTRSECDLSSADMIRKLVTEVRPEVIVNPAAYTSVDDAESNREAAYVLNCEAPAILAREARKTGAMFVHYSTDFVFDGRKSGEYVESDDPAPLNRYGASKLAGECAVAEAGGRFLVLRTSWLYSASGTNFLMKIRRLAREREEIKIVDDQVGSPTSAVELARATQHLVREYASRTGSAFPSGLYHATARGSVSRYDFAQAIVKALQGNGPLNVKCILPIASSEYPGAARRPLNSVLSNAKFESTFGFRLADWKICLHEVARELDGLKCSAVNLRVFVKALSLSLLALVLTCVLCQAQNSPQQEVCSAPEGCADVTPVRPPQLIAPMEKREREVSPEEIPDHEAQPLNPSQRKRVDAPVRPHTEFEQIVADTTGRALPLFGQSLFAQPPSTFAPADRVQVPGDYVVGPDDELQIRIWGQLNADLRVLVDRSGQIYIPRVGQIQVAGVHYSDLDQFLKNEVSKLFRNFSMTVNIGRIRAIQVFVVGQAQYPGTYTISSLSTLVNAIFASGGPTAQGSLRDVQVQRDGKTVAHFDFYELLVKGDKSKDVRLQSGDVLYYPSVGPLAAIVGSVNTPAIYELKRGTRLEELIDTAGGLSSVADSSKVTVERIGESQSRSVLEFPIDAQSRALMLKDGDIVRVFSLVPRFGNAVTLRGSVVNPGRYPWKQGMRVRDLIPDAQSLLTRSYWFNREIATDGRSTEYPVRERTEIAQHGEAPGGIQTEDPRRDLLEADGQSTGHTGSERALTGHDERPVTRHGKITSATLTEELHRVSPEINWSYAIIQRVNPQDLSTKLVRFDLGKAVLEGDPASNLELLPDDIITIFSQSDVAVPQSTRTRYVRIEGEVARPGVYEADEGELLRDVVARAGGVTKKAYIYGTQLTRESARVEQQKSIDELALSLEAELRQAMVSAAARSASPDDAQGLAPRATSQEALIAQLKNTKATGRVVLALSPRANSIDAYPEIALEDNDQILIPHEPSTVAVMGMVYNAGSFVFSPKRKVADYLGMAGKGRPNADMHHAFVLHADGSVTASTAVNSAFAGDRFSSLQVHPGDQIIVPGKIPSGSFMRGLRDWTQIASQLSITGAALAVIR